MYEMKQEVISKTGKFAFANKSELSALLGISRVTLDDLIKRGLPYEGPLPDKNNRRAGWKFHVPTVVRWLALEERRKIERELALSGEEKMTFDEAKRLKEESQAKLAKIELEEKIGSVVPIEIVAKEWEKKIVKCRQRLMGIGVRVASRLGVEKSEKKRVAIIDEEVRDALTILSEE